MTADKRDADAVAVALQLASEDRWSPPAPAPVAQMPHTLVPVYIQAPPPVASSVLYVSPKSAHAAPISRRVRRRPRPHKRT